MPSSRPNHIPAILGFVQRLGPRSVLDIGVGFGKWGHLIREYTDIRLSERDPARYQPDHWQVKIDGIEGFPGYLTPMHEFVYDRIYIGDAREIIEDVGRYDMILLADVIEHMGRTDGEVLLHKCLDQCDGAVVISTPSVFTPQEDACGNPLEVHRSLWTARDFKRFAGARVTRVPNEILLAALPAPGMRVPSLAPPGTTWKERLRRLAHRVRTRIGQ